MSESDASSDVEDSFFKAKHVRTPKARAIIESDSDENDSSSQGENESEDDSDERSKGGDVEDSFDEEAIDESLQNVQLGDKNQQSTSAGDIVDTTDDEADDFAPQVSEDEIVDSTDDEEANLQKKKSGDTSEQKQEDNEVPKIDSQIQERVFNNSIYREKAKESSDDEEELESNINQDSDDDDFKSVVNNSDNSAEIIENSFSIVEVSSDDEPAASSTLKQTSIKSFLSNPNVPQKKTEPQPIQNTITQGEYQAQIKKIGTIEAELLRARNAMRIIKLESLPDKGKSLVEKAKSLDKMLQEQKDVLAKMQVEEKPALSAHNKVEIAWDEIQAGVNDVGPRTLGQKGVARFNVEKKLAVETLDHLHKSLETCPTENDFAEDPRGLKVPLMPHQRRALAWLLWREKQKPSGGLLADDMGLGKTLTMISLVLKSKELGSDDVSEKENYRDKYAGGTLVVCPASLMNQWSGEIERRTKRGLLGVELYHGAKRETKARRLANHDVVITTYSLIQNEYDRDGAVFGVRWRRIILDEAHQIRNYKSKTAEAVFRLSGKSRWSLTGTPVHNKELDMFAILKFLRCSPFDDLQVWKTWVGSKSSGGEMRLHAVISSLMLRRTKAELQEKGSLRGLPDRTWELISVKLDKDEMDVYQRVLIFSRTLFAQFLHQRAEKNQDAYDLKFGGMPPDPNNEFFKMRNKLLQMNRVKDVSQHEILVLLLRLRQICCHPCLIKQMLQGDEDLGDADDEDEPEELNLMEQLNKLTLDDDDHPSAGLSNENVGLKEASKGFLNPANPVFRSERPSSKIKVLVERVKEKVSSGDKAIVVSQWTSLLHLVAIHMKEARIIFDNLDGKVPVPKRMAIVDNFNDQKSDTKVLLLSLTAGGVGLNLVGANHLFLLDLHWNPQLESQAQDRIYRMGQNKPIFVYKLMALETIEERIKALQDKKLEIANSMLTGSKRVSDSKLSLQDLKMLFDFK